MQYTIPRKLKEEVKILDKPFKIYLKDICFAGLCVAFFCTCSMFIHSWLTVPYWIFAVITTLYMILPAGKNNPQKRKWQVMYYTLLTDKNVYRSIDPGISGNLKEVRYNAVEKE